LVAFNSSPRQNINTPVKAMALVVFLRMGVSSSEDKVSESINRL
jgi:hypothetical protein